MPKASSLNNRHEQYLTEHGRLARLFTIDRFAFELERKRILKEHIDDMCNPIQRRAKQKKLEASTQAVNSIKGREK
ncbi:MAG: hypothetical protein DSY80_03590 [Desulfocapsa sp.]|nr:MAG: hypothetical protein DSY80_03590 [Desulfocapsa sp.]